MPEGTRVHDCVDEAKKRGGVNPYAVCQAATGQNYATGKPIKGIESEEDKPMNTKDMGIEDGHEPGDEAVHEEVGAAPDAAKDLPGADEPAHPFGYQVIQRKYQEHADHLKDHEDMLGPLEDDAVRKYLEDEQEWHAKRMEDAEKLVSGHKRYKDLPPLTHGYEDEEEGEKDLDDAGEDQGDMDTLDDAGVPEDAEPQRDLDEPTPEEVVEGMTTKDLDEDDEDQKSLRNGHAKKHLCGPCAKAMNDPDATDEEKGLCPKCLKAMLDDEDETTDEKDLDDGDAPDAEEKRLGRQIKSVEERDGGFWVLFGDGTERGPFPDEDAAMKVHRQPDVSAKDYGALDSDEYEQKDNDLEPHETAAVGEAAGFLKAAAEPDSEWGEEQRFHSFHYHKTLKAIGDVDDAGSLGGDVGAVPGEEAKTLAVCMNCRGSGYGPDGEPCHECNGTGKVNKSFPDPDNDSGLKEPSHPSGYGDGGAKDLPEDEQEAKSEFVGDPDYWKEEAAESEHKSAKRALIKAAAGFFKELSETREFGDSHRERAKAAAIDLDGVAAPPEEKDGDDLYEPGEMGEKGLSWIEHGDDLVAQDTHGHKYVIYSNSGDSYKTGLGLHLQRDGQNIRKGTLSILKAAAEEMASKSKSADDDLDKKAFAEPDNDSGLPDAKPDVSMPPAKAKSARRKAISKDGVYIRDVSETGNPKFEVSVYRFGARIYANDFRTIEEARQSAKIRAKTEDVPVTDETKSLSDQDELEESTVQKVLKRKRLKKKATPDDDEPDPETLKKSLAAQSNIIQEFRRHMAALSSRFN